MRKKLYIDYMAIQGLFFILMGIFCGYGSYILLSYGYSASQTGIIMATGSMLSAILQSISANISDNSKKVTLFEICSIICVFCVGFIILTYTQKSPTLITAALYVLSYASYATFEPLNNAIPGILENAGYKISYGVGRATGSFGYAIANIILGFLTSKFPYRVSILLAIIVAILLLIFYLKTSKDFRSIKTENTSVKQENIPYSTFLKNHKNFILLLVASSFIFLGFMMVDNMMILLVNYTGGTSKDLGFIMAFKAFLEIPVIFFFDKINEKFNEKILLIVGGISFLIKAILHYMATNIFTVYLAQITSLTSLALYIPAMVSYINKIMNPKEAVRGQTLNVTFLTITSVISSFLAGRLNDAFSTKALLLVSVIVSLIGVILISIILRKDDK